MREVCSLQDWVSPCRELTIPRLELLLALLLARLLASVTRSLSPNLSLGQPTCYTDSQVVLYWIDGHGKEWKQFIQNCVSEIRDLLPVSSWRHCPGSDNPADLPSRGLTPTELSTNRLWHCGPDWLRETPDESLSSVKEMPPDCLSEMKSKDKQTYSLLIGNSTISLENVMQCEQYGSLSRLLSVTAYVIRFVQALKQAAKGRHPPGGGPNVDPQSLSKAETMWIQESQRQLMRNRLFPTWRGQFRLYCDKEGVWRSFAPRQHFSISEASNHAPKRPSSHSAHCEESS